MTDPTIISPLLDGFVMGSPMSEKNGSVCCPALKENSEKKYIVKIISVPATQAQMDALLLAGAYKDPADAMDYFQRMAQELVAETKVLESLAAENPGFAPYEGSQIEPITRRRLGYYVYLLGSYKRSLDKHVHRNPVTHLEAVNLGLDLCAALTACRKAGYLYVDLKPANIFVTPEKRYQIGDLGFLDRSALKYLALPDRYRSAYTPPELSDPMATIDETVDTYALGLILYQLYNDSQLPQCKEGEAIPAPVNADYEIAEIILKAISPDPAQRWENPEAMQAALVAYMQRNSINDTPITPYTPLDIPQDAPAEVVPSQEEPAAEATQPTTEAVSQEETEQETPATPGDDTAPTEADGEDLLPHEMSEEVSQILEQADDLIAHQMPQEVVVPPEPEDPFAFAMEEEVVDDLPAPTEADMADAEEEKRRVKEAKRQEQKKKLRKALSAIAVLLVLALLAGGAAWAYQNLYLQSIEGLTITGDQYALVVSVDTQADQSLLSVTCSDNHGLSQTKGVENGQAVFEDLQPDTLYKIQLEIEGFHQLVGQTSDIFTTDSTTKIIRFTAVTGNEDGSVVLSFTPTGGEPEEWVMKYVTDGEEERMEIFSGHSVTITGLTLGKKYTFTLEPNAEASLSGETTLEFLASRLILAENLRVTASDGTNMTVRWEAPGDILVDQWDVRCYSDSGYEQQLTVTDTQATFEGIDPTVAYTIEVVADGMTQPARTSITANPITITSLTADETDPEQLMISWDYTGASPEGGWLLMYTIDGSAVPNVIKCNDPNAVIQPRIPSANYEFTVQAADSTSIFSNIHSHITAGAEVFEANGLSADSLDAHLLVTPEEEGWTYESVGRDAFADSFTAGDALSLVLHCGDNFYLQDLPLNVLFVFRDAFGNVLPELTGESELGWKDLWYARDYHYGELDLPTAPDTAGDYSLSVYFNGLAVAVLTFTMQ